MDNRRAKEGGHGFVTIQNRVLLWIDIIIQFARF